MSMVTEAPLKNAVPTDQELIDFVVREARLIDQQRFDEWLDMYRRRRLLLDAAGMESDRSAADLLADVRGQAAALDPGRAAQGRAHLQPEAEEPLPSRAADAAGGFARRRRQQLRHLDPIHYVETRLDEQALYAAWVTHHLSGIDGELRIKLKRVDLINCDAAFGNIQLFM